MKIGGHETKMSRGWFWLILALVGGGVILALAGEAASGYIQDWLGKLFKAASGAYLAFWITKDLLSLDVWAIKDPHERAMGLLSRSIVIAAGIIGVCLT